MTTDPRRQAIETIKKMSAEKLLDVWELTTTYEANYIDVPTVRGWLMDEIEKRYPEAFDKWLEDDKSEDADLRKYIKGEK